MTTIPRSLIADEQTDILIIGAGLAGLLLAYRLQVQLPQKKIIILEQNKKLIGDKTWSFHHDDLNNPQLWQDFLTHTWPEYEVRFNYQRILSSPYHTVSSKHFFETMSDKLSENFRLGQEVRSIMGQVVTTKCGKTYTSPVIFDSRPDADFTLEKMNKLKWGFQKFYGLEIRTLQEHKVPRPLLMDATVEQIDGYRFIYILPYDSHTLLVEDTRYSNSSDLDIAELENKIYDYVAQQGWKIDEVLRTESGILPIPTTRLPKELHLQNSCVLKIGTTSGLYHPVTGYSFLWSAKVAEKLSGVQTADLAHFSRALAEIYQDHKRTEWFYLLLNKLMFFGATAEKRRNIFIRFYKLSDKTISRFYASRTNFWDCLRLLIGKPPISILSALKAITRNGELN